jgi:cyanophycinase-like exopeptidase
MAASQSPVYLIGGGRSSRRLDPDPLVREALRLGPSERPSVAYIGAASGDNPLFRAMMTRLLARAGAGKVRLAPLCGSRADPQKAMRIIEGCSVVFLSGGDVEEGMKVLEEKGMVDFLRNLHRQGKPFFGLSAGSIMLAERWVRWADPRVDSSAELFPCLGIAEVHCDTHDEENGWEELLSLARLIPDASVCYGICSGTALAAYPDGSVRALGGKVQRFTRKGRIVTEIESLVPGPGPANPRQA